MSFEKTPSGTRGSRAPYRSNPFTRFIGRVMIKLIDATGTGSWAWTSCT